MISVESYFFAPLNIAETRAFVFRFRQPRGHDANRLRGHQHQPRSDQRRRHPHPPQRPDEVRAQEPEAELQLDARTKRVEVNFRSRFVQRV